MGCRNRPLVNSSNGSRSAAGEYTGAPLDWEGVSELDSSFRPWSGSPVGSNALFWLHHPSDQPGAGCSDPDGGGSKLCSRSRRRCISVGSEQSSSRPAPDKSNADSAHCHVLDHVRQGPALPIAAIGRERSTAVPSRARTPALRLISDETLTSPGAELRVAHRPPWRPCARSFRRRQTRRLFLLSKPTTDFLPALAFTAILSLSLYNCTKLFHPAWTDGRTLRFCGVAQPHP